MGDLIVIILYFAVVLTVYFLPTIIAMKRRAWHVPSIFIMNFLLAWTVFVWVGLLIWACVDERDQVHIAKDGFITYRSS